MALVRQPKTAGFRPKSRYENIVRQLLKCQVINISFESFRLVIPYALCYRNLSISTCFSCFAEVVVAYITSQTFSLVKINRFRSGIVMFEPGHANPASFVSLLF